MHRQYYYKYLSQIKVVQSANLCLESLKKDQMGYSAFCFYIKSPPPLWLRYLFLDVLTEASASAVTNRFTVPLRWLLLFLCVLCVLHFPALCSPSNAFVFADTHRRTHKPLLPLCVWSCVSVLLGIRCVEKWGKSHDLFLTSFFRLGFRITYEINTFIWFTWGYSLKEPIHVVGLFVLIHQLSLRLGTQ